MEPAQLARAGLREVWIAVHHRAAEIQAALDSVPSLTGPTPFAEDYLPFTHRETRCVADGMPITRYWHEKKG